jgi:CheY-like chemotaxis protein
MMDAGEISIAPAYLAKPPGAPESVNKCVLLVEDELLIRLPLSDELRGAGYDVIEAFNADEAVAILRLLVRIDLIISDVRMPGALDGIGLLGVIRERYAALPVIIMSGHLEPSLALTQGANRFLHKPFTPAMMLTAVQEELTK